jgi:hypothetical protein
MFVVNKEDFCYDLCIASKKMGYGLKREGNGFVWLAHPFPTLINSKPGSDDKESLYNACVELKKTIQPPP